MATISRGIQPVKWKNADGSRTERYRVQIKRKNIVVDRLFDSPELAELFIQDSKTESGRLAIANGTDRASQQIAQTSPPQLKIAQDYMQSGRLTLEAVVKLYVDTYLEPSIKSEVDHVQRTAKVNKNRLNNTLKVQVGYIKPGYLEPIGALAGLREHAKGYKKQPIGQFFLDEITEQEATEWVRERLAMTHKGKPIAKSTVKRELGALRSAVNKLRYTSSRTYKKMGGVNPFEFADKSLVKGGTKKRRRIISAAEEEALKRELIACRNPEMVMIFCLALATGMRRGELLSVKWDQVNLEGGYIHLEGYQTKNGEERLVHILPAAITLLGKMKRREDGKLFGYTIEGFKSVFARVRKRANLTDIRMHDTRRNFVSVFLNEITNSPVKLADFLGAKSVRSLVESTVAPIQDLNGMVDGKFVSQEAMMRSIAHADPQTTFGYTVTQQDTKK